MPIYLSDDVCNQARDKLIKLLDAADEKGIAIQHKAADSLLRHCLTQQRYQLQPQTPTDFARALGRPHSSAQQLARLTPEELDRLNEEMAVGYPGKPDRDLDP